MPILRTLLLSAALAITALPVAASPVAASPVAAPAVSPPAVSPPAVSPSALSPPAVSPPPVAHIMASSAADRAEYRAPTPGVLSVLNPFDDISDPYAPGHRGVDLALPAGGPVRAAGAGVVRFAGSVAGRALVVLQHPDGVSTEYEPLSVAVKAGQQVAIGQVLGTLAGSHQGCSASCLHWGAQRAGRYFDPLSLLAPLGIVRLAPCHARGWACS